MEGFVGGCEGDVKVGDQGMNVVVARGHQCEGRLMITNRNTFRSCCRAMHVVQTIRRYSSLDA